MWEIKTTDTFDEWFSRLEDTDRVSVLASLIVLREKGPQLPRPYADTVKGSRYSNMKEACKAEVYRYGHSLPLIHAVAVFCFVLVARPVMRSVFTR